MIGFVLLFLSYTGGAKSPLEEVQKFA